MKIYTKKGDGGETSLIGGDRVRKDSLRIDSYGTVDELNSFVGLLRDQDINAHQKKVLIEIQDRLFTIGSLLAESPNGSKMQLPKVYDEDVQLLEKEMDAMDAELPPMRNFVLPGGHTAVSTAHVCRTVCRRAERLTVNLQREEPVDGIIITYLNRLSDYLFVLARMIAHQLKVEEVAWHPRQEKN